MQFPVGALYTQKGEVDKKMALTFYRKYGKTHTPNKSRRVDKGNKKKARRIFRANQWDGWERKRAGTLAPVFRPSKTELIHEWKHF